MSDHGGLHPAQPFPAAAREQVVKAQLRANLRKVTTTIRAKRANVVEELPHWEQLRTLGRRRRTPRSSTSPTACCNSNRASGRGAGTSTGRGTRRKRATSWRASHRRTGWTS